MIARVSFLYGVFFSLPLSFLNILPFGVKIDDLILCFLLGLLSLQRISSGKKISFNKYAFLFVAISAFFALVSLIISNLNISFYLGDDSITVFFRVVQSLLIILLISWMQSQRKFVDALFSGILLGSFVSLIVFLCYFFAHVNVSMFLSRGVYFTKDIFQYTDNIPFTVHVNTLGSFFLISFFIIYFKSTSWHGKLASFLFVVPSFLLIAKGDLVAISFFFMVLYFSHSSSRRLILCVLTLLCIAFSPAIFSLYHSLNQYRVYTSERDEIYISAFKSILENPLGYGLGSQNNVIFNASGINFPAHNIFLSLGLEFGWLYLLCFIVFICIWLFRSKVEAKNKLVFICYLLIGLFGNAMYFYKYHTIVLAISMFSLWGRASYESMLHAEQKYC
ncbi:MULTISPECIES: O-antigen ligase family protein [Hafnia]|uniref:O-antigen ligase family protein n=1 Tax=Hafnia TaxID=568 RepID=UPI0026729945|nr:O-antigen ligase family protein [Hafnia paralvei]